jgi:hypothetical protein
MRIDRFLNRRSTIWNVTQSDEVDDYGNPITNGPTRRRVQCYFAPWSTQGAQTEENVDRATTSDDWLYVVPKGTRLTSADHVDIDGETGTFEVIGEPTAAWNPLQGGRLSHVAARLRRTAR